MQSINFNIKINDWVQVADQTAEIPAGMNINNRHYEFTVPTGKKGSFPCCSAVIQLDAKVWKFI